MLMSLQPQEIDFEREWAELKKDLDLSFDGNIEQMKYTEQYGRVYRICIAVDSKSSELYTNISHFLEERAEFISNGLVKLTGAELLEAYYTKWNGYKRAASKTNNICRYLNLNHIETRRYDAMDVQLTSDLDDILPVKDLSFEKWKTKVLAKVDEELVTACLACIERMRMGEQLAPIEKDYVKCAINSFSEVCHYKPRTPLQLYQEKFEQKFLNDTSHFYDQQARKFLESGDVGNYMAQVLQVLHDEECRAFEFLDRSTMPKQKQRIEKSLIHDGLDFLFEQAVVMVERENEEHLNKLYKLLKNMEAPLAKLVKMFKNNVERIGKGLIREAKTPKDFVDIICKHYDDYSRFVNNVFVTAIDQDADLASGDATVSTVADKNFIESLKDAMRTVVNHRESEKERAKAPEWLATYSDQLLKKRGIEDIEVKLGEVIKCLCFVTEKDYFQQHYQRRLVKRLIFGHSSNADAELLMIEKLKSVCVYEFSSKIKRIYEDIKSSAAQQDEFNKKYKDNEQGVNIDVKVIQDGCWPFPKTLPNFNLPSCLEQSVKDFTDFYEEKEGRKRRLKWFYHHSQADVKTCRTKRMYVLKVMTFQLGILHCFNSQDQLTIAEIREETALDMKELLKNLRPFIENDVLKVASGSGELTPGSLIIANDEFVKRGTTIKLMPTSQKDKGDGMTEREKGAGGVIQSVEDDRRFWLQACIARIMKRVKTANFTDLIGMIQREAAQRFQPSVPLIKKVIDILLEKNFIERKEDMRDTYVYVA